MALDRRLLDILCCPTTGVPLQMLSKEKLQQLNAKIAAGGIRQFNDEVVTAPLQAALITENGGRIYRVDDGIPVMLEETAISGRVLRAQ
jgi:uncharacterized protein YbaR (Trm112 family)